METCTALGQTNRPQARRGLIVSYIWGCQLKAETPSTFSYLAARVRTVIALLTPEWRVRTSENPFRSAVRLPQNLGAEMKTLRRVALTYGRCLAPQLRGSTEAWLVDRA